MTQTAPLSAPETSAPPMPATAGPEDITLDAVLAEIRERRTEFEHLTYVPQDMVTKLQAVGCYRAFVPKELGGDALSPADYCRLIETISAADASTGWVASFGVSTIYLAALPPEHFAAIYRADPDTVFAGALFPPQKAIATDAGIRISGRWKYCSGSMGASVIGVGVKVEGLNDGGLPRMAVMPRDKVRIEMDWNVIGLAGTGSHDVVVDDVLVPEDWTFVRGGAPRRDETIFRYPSMALAAQVLAVVGLGTARDALDTIRRIAEGYGSITGAPTIGKRAYVQSELAKAEAKLRSARGYFYEATEAAWETLLAGDAVSPEARTHLRLASTHAAHTGAEVARTAFYLAGTSAIVTGHPLSRAMNDAAAVAQHAFLGEGTWQSAGGVFLGQPGQPGYP